MSRPTSFRLSEPLLNRLASEASVRGVSLSELAATLLDEGTKSLRFSGIIFETAQQAVGPRFLVARTFG